MRKKPKYIIAILLIVLIGIFHINKESYSFNLVNNSNKNIKEEKKDELFEENLTVHYLDVGQGDSCFLELPNNQTMLIDGAQANKKDIIINYIKELGYSKIDYVIATHPHEDHIGSLKYIIETFDIGSIFMPKVSSTSKTYENLLKAIINKDLKIKTARSNLKMIEDENFKIEFIAPTKESYQNLNNYSAVIQISYYERKFLFMADAEKESEEELPNDIKADVIKVGHHGSNTSSTTAFVNKVKPEYAIISVAKDNSYNHPSLKVIEKWQSVGAKVLRTDQDGTIIIKTNGIDLNIKTTKER